MLAPYLARAGAGVIAVAAAPTDNPRDGEISAMSDHAAHDQTTAPSASHPRPTTSPAIQDIIASRLSRRSALLGMAAAAGAGMFGGRLFGGASAAAAAMR